MKANFKNIKRMLAMLLAVMMTLSCFMLIACGGEGEKENTNDTDNNQQGGTGEENNGTTGEENNGSTTGSEGTGENNGSVTGSEDVGGDDKPGDDTAADAKPLTLNIGTYNIANGRQVSHNMVTLAKDILSQKLDIVGLQEVDQFCDRSKNMDTMKTLSQLTGMPYYTFFKAINLSGNGAGGVGEYGVGVLSKYPIVESERIPLYSSGEQRVLGRTKIDVNGTTINFFSTHLEWSPDATRYKQLEQLNGIITEYDNFVVVGDFNVHTLEEYRKLDYKGMVNTEEKPILTYSADDGDWYLDNIIYSPEDWTFGEPTTLPNGHSDHFMLAATGTFLPKNKNTAKDSQGKELPKLTDGYKATGETIGKWAAGTKGAYVEIDLGKVYSITSVNVINALKSENVYKWAAYATSDASLPIDQWTKIAEKAGDEVSTAAGYTAAVAKGYEKIEFRYVRIYAVYNSGSEDFEIAEINLGLKMYDDGSVNIVGSSATVKTQDGKPKSSLKDGNTTQYLSIGEWAKNCYVEIDLGRAAYLSSVKMFNLVGEGENIYKFAVYATNDPTLPIEQWTKIGEKNGDEFADEKGYAVKVPAELKKEGFRYVRIYGTYSSANKKFNVCEVQVFGTYVPDLANLAPTSKATAGKGGECPIVIDGATDKYFDLGYWCDSDENEAAGIPIGLGGECYIEIDLLSLYNLKSINVVNLINATRVYKWTAVVTDDNTKPIDQWTELGGKTNDDTASAEGFTLELTEAQQALNVRYVRIYGMYHNTNWGYHINEISIAAIAEVA